MLKNHNGLIGNIDIQEVAILISNTGPKILADTAVPGRPEGLVHVVLNGFDNNVELPCAISS